MSYSHLNPKALPYLGKPLDEHISVLKCGKQVFDLVSIQTTLLCFLFLVIYGTCRKGFKYSCTSAYKYWILINFFLLSDFKKNSQTRGVCCFL